ncbi:hypothetical protein ACFX2G_035903 [Malus domestica]
MKKVHVVLGIPVEYREWCWLPSLLRRENNGLPPREEIKRIKDEKLTRPITAVEPGANGGGRKRSSSPACEPSVEKKPITSSIARRSSSVAENLVIDLTFPKGVKMTVEPEPVKPAAPKVTASIAERLAQHMSLVVPLVSRFVSKSPSGAKFSFASKRFVAIKSGKVDFATKVAPRLIPSSAMTDLSVEKGKSTHTGNCKRSTESEAGEFPKVCALLKADLLEDIDACAKFIDSVGKVVIRSDSFAKRPAYSKRSSLIATMHKTLILVVESMRVDQDAVKCAKEVEMELLEIAQQKVAHLNVRLSATQAMLEIAENEVSRVSQVVEDFECVNSELRSACFAKDDELIFMHAEMSHLKQVASKLESKEMDQQGALSSENLKNELDEFHGAHTGLVEENVQLKDEKVGHEVALVFCQANFYKLGYVDHLQSRSSDYEFSEKDFKTFSISPVDFLDFSLDVAFGGAAEGQAVQAGVAEDKLMETLAAGSGAAAEGVAVGEPVVAQAAKK